MLKLAFDKYKLTFTEGSSCECMEWLIRKQSKRNIKIFAWVPTLSETYQLQLRECNFYTLDP